MAPSLRSPPRAQPPPQSRGLSVSRALAHRQSAAPAASPTTWMLPAVAAAAAPRHGRLLRPSSRSIIVPAPIPLKNPKPECQAERALHYGSSGSLHHEAGQHDHVPLSALPVSLSEMVHQFLEEVEDKGTKDSARGSPSTAETSACGRARCNCSVGVSGGEFCAAMDKEEEEEDEDSSIRAQIEILQGYTTCGTEAESDLRLNVERAIAEMMMVFSQAENIKFGKTNALSRSVMRRLRDIGYNAAACKSRWNHGNGLPAGSYEYIDVLVGGIGDTETPAQDVVMATSLSRRIIVDIDFRTQFEIARQSSEYQKLLAAVPAVFVGKAEGVRQVVRMMSQAAKRSLRAHGLLVAPWHKHKYMEAKWLSPIYRRTTSMHPSKKKRLALGSCIGRSSLQIQPADSPLSPSSTLVYRQSRRHLMLNSIRDVCTAMSTNWQPPPVECRAFSIRVSALSMAIESAKCSAFNATSSALSLAMQNGK